MSICGLMTVFRKAPLSAAIEDSVRMQRARCKVSAALLLSVRCDEPDKLIGVGRTLSVMEIWRLLVLSSDDQTVRQRCLQTCLLVMNGSL